MAVLEVRLYPDAILKTPSREVDLKDPAVQSFIKDLVETLQSFPGCVGLAAPQLGRPWRVIAVEASRYRKDPGEHHGLFVLINPQIVQAEGAQVIREGCLSIPKFTGNVRRASRLAVEGLDPIGRKVRYQTQDFEAIIMQHEMDHLDGLLFLDRIVSRRSDLFSRKRYQQP